MKPYKILIIEDDLIIQSELRTLLCGNGYDVFVVTDFSRTIQQVKEKSPHLILLDIKLPQENGFSLCSQIRSFSYIPIIFVTSCNTDMDELNSIMLGDLLTFVNRKIENILKYNVHIKKGITNKPLWMSKVAK